MKIYDVVIKLIGEIKPIGETNEDMRRFENLKEMIQLTDKLLFTINNVASLKDRQEYSISKAGKFAAKFMQDINEADHE